MKDRKIYVYKLIIVKNLWFMVKLFMIKEIFVRLLNNNEALSTSVFLRDFILKHLV